MDDIFRETLGFLAMMLGTLMDPIALPCYIAIGLFVRNLGGALAASIGFNVAFRVVMAAIKSNVEGGVQTGSPDFEVVAASIAGGALVTGMSIILLQRTEKKFRKNQQKMKGRHTIWQHSQEHR
jgi:hypothetical protein